MTKKKERIPASYVAEILEERDGARMRAQALEAKANGLERRCDMLMKRVALEQAKAQAYREIWHDHVEQERDRLLLGERIATTETTDADGTDSE